MVQRYSGLDLTQEYTRALVRTLNGYVEQSVRTSYATVVRRAAGVAGVSLLRSVVNGEAIRVNFASGVSMAGMANLFTADGIVNANPEVAEMGKLFATAVQNNVSRRVGMLAIHEEAAQRSQQAVISAYDRLVESVSHVHYREGQNRLPNKLGEALRRPDFNQATVDGVVFANTGMLDAVAAHWYRLNYGAGSRGGAFLARSQVNSVRFFGQLVGTLTDNRGPSAAFLVPRGVFLDASNTVVPFNAGRRGQDIFFPVGLLSGVSARLTPESAPGGPVVSKGIVGRHFLDAGLNVLTTFLPQQYEIQVKKWLDEASKEVGRRGPLRNTLTPESAGSLASTIQLGQSFSQRSFLR